MNWIQFNAVSMYSRVNFFDTFAGLFLQIFPFLSHRNPLKQIKGKFDIINSVLSYVYIYIYIYVDMGLHRNPHVAKVREWRFL